MRPPGKGNGSDGHVACGWVCVPVSLYLGWLCPFFLPARCHPALCSFPPHLQAPPPPGFLPLFSCLAALPQPCCCLWPRLACPIPPISHLKGETPGRGRKHVAGCMDACALKESGVSSFALILSLV